MTAKLKPDVAALPRILIIGLSAGGGDSLPSGLQARIMKADLLVGGRRHLAYFPDFTGPTFTIGPDMQAVVDRLHQARAAAEQAVVLASGDPLCFGIGATLRRFFEADDLEIVPAPTAFQQAFAALAEPWHGAALLSAHARPLNDVVNAVLGASKAAILTDRKHTPVAVAQALIGAGVAAGSPCAVCENLGSSEQRVVHTTLAQIAQQSYAPLNVFVVWPAGSTTGGAARQLFEVSPLDAAGLITPTTIPPGLADKAFSTSGGQITKREVRLLSLAEIGLGPDQVMWDIGAGSGSVGLEAARAQPAAVVYAIEKRAALCAHIRENLARFPAPNLALIEGVAPEDTEDWPAPDAVFVGGSGGRIAKIIKTAQQRLRSGGRLVINLATLENLYTVSRLLPGARVTQIQVNRGVPIMDMLRFEALSPVFIVTWSKSEQE